jgi:urease accessory protein UreF
MDSFLSLLQFTDGLFPAGAYAHSFGLEYCVQSSEICERRRSRGFSARLSGKFAVAPTDAVAMLCAGAMPRRRVTLLHASPWMKHSTP